MSRVHIIGAGLAGLACAVRLVNARQAVSLYEAAPQAGGRCRSMYDERLERVIDNGNHFLLSANDAALDYLEEIGARDTLSAPPDACFPFVDLRTGERWTLRPTNGPVPWWIFMPGRRVAGAGALSHLRGLRLAFARENATVSQSLGRAGDRVWERLWEPLAVAILNTEAEAASARLLRDVLSETFAKGSGKCQPLTALTSLSASFVEPAMALLGRAGAQVHLGYRLRRLEGSGGEITSLNFGDRRIAVEAGDTVVLAVPPSIAAGLMPGLTIPQETRPIVNAHIRLPHRARLPEGIPFLGLVGGTAQWLFLRQDLASITVSAANDLVERPAKEIARILWQDTAKALTLDPRWQPPMRVIKERRATIAQTPDALRQRPGTRTHVTNLLLAGDWTDTGLPATIEGAVRSGQTAAEETLARAEAATAGRRIAAAAQRPARASESEKS